MTREVLSKTPVYTISGTGPYTVTHPYRSPSDFLVAAEKDGTITALDLTDFTVEPERSDSVGALTLTTAAASEFDGAKLAIVRDTLQEQGWVGNTAREKGLEAQLDILTMGLQDLGEISRRTFKVPVGSTGGVIRTGSEGTVPMFDEQGNLTEGPTANQVILAEAFAIRAEQAAEPFASSIEAMIDYRTLQEFKAAVSGGFSRSDGGRAAVGRLVYKAVSGSTAIPGLPGWEPSGTPNQLHFGAVSDVQIFQNGAISAAGFGLSGTGSFVASDIGKAIKVEGAGPTGSDLVTTIATVIDATNVTLSDSASTTVAGATCTFGTDSTAAFDAAFAYLDNAEQTYAPVSAAREILTIGNAVHLNLEDGHYIYNGSGAAPANAGGRNMAIIGTDTKTVFINIFSDAYLIDYPVSGPAANSVFCEGFTTIGGKGLYFNRQEVSVPQAYQIFNRIHILAFSEIGIGSVWGDSPRWAVTNSVLETTRPNTKGILCPPGIANPDFSNTTIIGCTYKVVLSDTHQSLSILSGMTLFSLPEDGHEADIWIQPVDTAAEGFGNTGQGVVIKNNRFSNEYREGKPVILIASPDGVGDYWKQGHSAVTSTFAFRDWQMVDNVISGQGSADNSDIAGPLIQAYTAELGRFSIRDNSVNVGFTHLLKLEVTPTVGYVSDGIIGPNEYHGGGERPLPCNLNVGIWRDRTEEIGSLSTPFAGGSGFDPNFSLLSMVSGDPVESAELSLVGNVTRSVAIEDALGNPSNAHEYSFGLALDETNYIQIPLDAVALTGVTGSGNIFVEFDVKDPGAQRLNEFDVSISMTTATGNEVIRRGVSPTADWNTIRIPVAANAALTAMSIKFYASSDAPVTVTSNRIAVGRPRVYRANRPVNFAHIVAKMSGWRGSRQILTGPETGQSVEIWPDWTSQALRYSFTGAPSAEGDGLRIMKESDMIAAAADFIAAAEFPPYATGSITPTLTCATPGTLSITSTNTCTWTRDGDTVRLRINFNITAVSKGTATGELRIGFADLPFIPVSDLAHGTILRKPKELNIADFGGVQALDTELSVGAGDKYATITYSTPAFALSTLQIVALEDYSGAAFNLSFNLEIFL